MSLISNLETVLVVDFGSQFTQLIARRVRETGIYSEIINHKDLYRSIRLKNIKAGKKQKTTGSFFSIFFIFDGFRP